MHVYEENGVFFAEIMYQSEKITKMGKTREEAAERLWTTLLVREMIG